MNNTRDRDAGIFINNSNIFEWTPGEQVAMRKRARSGFDAICSILDEIGYYGQDRWLGLISSIRLRKREELNPFETLVGGISWCIGYIRPEFNRDMTYSDEMTLGKKIAISEKIIVCLIQQLSLFVMLCRMKYPNRLSPQQIQGFDYKALQTLLLWLRDKIIEIRNSLPSYESLAAQQVFEDE